MYRGSVGDPPDSIKCGTLTLVQAAAGTYGDAGMQ